MEGQVLDLLLRKVSRVERIEGLAVVTHALGTMATHAIDASRDLAIKSV